ncbi:MAG: cytochrome c peroxidase [Bacteroidia bacterium]
MKRTTLLKSTGILTAALFALNSCTKETDPVLSSVSPNLPETPYNYSAFGGFSDPTYNHTATLGRVLFYERQLSANNSVSCASCHKQAFSFADNVAFSRGLNNEVTTRNSMPVINLSGGFSNVMFFEDGNISPDQFGPMGFGASFFWDGRESNLNQLAMRPVKNHVEMGITDTKALITKLNRLPYYPALFQNAFGSPKISVEKISQAIGTFMSSIQSTDSKNDRFLSTGDPTVFTSLENRGFNLFFETYNCAGCHDVFPGEYNSPGFFNIGLDTYSEDPGLAGLPDKSSERGVFRTPNLKNVALTAPYMHDGRFATLDDVLDHYSEGINETPGLALQLRNGQGQPLRMNIPDADRKALLAYLNTFTDYTVIADVKFSDPFVKAE